MTRPAPNPRAPRAAVVRLVPALLLAAAAVLAGCVEGDDSGSSLDATFLEVRFGGHHPQGDVEATIEASLSSRPTADQYRRDGIPHPDGFTAHDQLEAWRLEYGRTYAATSFNGSFGAGYFLTAIDGVTADGTTAYWALAINGQASDVGMSEAVLAEGDSVTWIYTPVGELETLDSAAGPAEPAKATLAEATFNVLFTAQPGHEGTSHKVLFDPARLSSAPMYEGTDTERATTYTVHDLMVDWTAQTGIPVEYSDPGAFGFGVNAIDGVGQPLSSSLPPYWCYTLNGDTADLGISLQTVAPGDVVEWEYSTCV
jgi:hypothetical protein